MPIYYKLIVRVIYYKLVARLQNIGLSCQYISSVHYKLLSSGHQSISNAITSCIHANIGTCHKVPTTIVDHMARRNLVLVSIASSKVGII